MARPHQRKEHDPPVLFLHQYFQRLCRVGRGDDHFDEEVADRVRQFFVHLAVGGDDPAVSGDLIALLSFFESLNDRFPLGGSTGVIVLDDRDDRIGEIIDDQFQAESISTILLNESSLP